MEIDLKNVRVTYTVKEIVAIIGVICSIAGSYIRTEIANHALEAQIVQLRGDLKECKDSLAAKHVGYPNDQR